MRISRLRRLVIPAAIGLVASLCAFTWTPVAAASPTASWPLAGYNVQGDRSQPTEKAISPTTVGSLKTKWVFADHGSESATPTVSDGVVFFPDFGGYLYALDAATGVPIWQDQISDLVPVAGVYSRTSPIIVGDDVIVGDAFPAADQPTGAHLIAVNRWTGKLDWITQVSSHPAAKITASPVAYRGNVYVGVSSNDELLNFQGTFHAGCCTSRGSLVSVNAATGALNWTWYDIPDDLVAACTSISPPSGCGYSGGSIWATPAIDPLTNSVVVATGNNYTASDAAVACENQAVKDGTSNADCSDPRDLVDAVASIDLSTGRLRWSYRTTGYDAFPAGENVTSGPDYDFGSGANVFVADVHGRPRDLVGIGQKSGIYFAFDAATGKLVWKTQVGPGGFDGGIEFGTATDGRRVYVPDANTENVSFTLADGRTWSAGSWAALDPGTGKILWQTPDPSSSIAYDQAAPTVADGVVFAGSIAPTGPNMYALDAATGTVLWSFASGGSVGGGPAVVDGTVYWGSGYANDAYLGGTSNDQFYAFVL